MKATKDLIVRVRHRLALRCAVEDAQVGLAAAAGTALVLVVIRRFAAPAMDSAWPPALEAIGAVAAGAAVPLAGWLSRRRRDADVAAAADLALGLRERVSTALWLDSPGADRSSLDPLVVADADGVAARVRGDELSRAFRPSLRPAPMIAAGALAAAIAAFSLIGAPAADAVETVEARTKRLADENRVAEVARKIEQAARHVEQTAVERKLPQLATEAAVIRRTAERLKREPPPPEHALQQLSTLLDAQRENVRKRGEMKPTDDPKEMLEQERQLAELLRQMAEAKAESLQEDLKDLARRLEKDPKSADAPTGDDMREMAKRLDALRKAAKAADEAGMDSSAIRQKLRDLANQDVLDRISEELRKMAAKSDQRDYQGLEDESRDFEDLGEMSREDLEKMLKELEELNASDKLKEMLEGAKSEMAGGRKLRLGGSGGT